MIIFDEMRCRMTKMNITFSVGNGVPNIVFKFLPQKKKLVQAEWKPKNRFSLHIFPCISDSVGLTVSKNNKVHPWVDAHQQCEF